MLRAVCAIVLIVTVVISAAPQKKPYYDINNAPALFDKFVEDHNRVYKDDDDREEHYNAFVKNLQVINKSNAESDSAVFDLNDFSDYTPEETKNLYGFNPKGLDKTDDSSSPSC